jgi:hypothetical protein
MVIANPAVWYDIIFGRDDIQTPGNHNAIVFEINTGKIQSYGS